MYYVYSAMWALGFGWLYWLSMQETLPWLDRVVDWAMEAWENDNEVHRR